MDGNPLNFINEAKNGKEVTTETYVTNVSSIENDYANVETTLPPELVPDDSGGYILIPLIVLFGILILSALVYLMARNRHIYTKRRCPKKLKYNDKNNDDDAALLGCDELDDPTEYLLNGKLEIDSRYNTYKTTNVSHDRFVAEIHS